MAEYVVWWLDQSAWEIAEAFGAPGKTWPKYLKDEFESRGGRSGRGRLWSKIYPEALINWLDSDPRFEATSKDCGGLVMLRSDAHHVLAWPGFITDLGLRIIEVPA